MSRKIVQIFILTIHLFTWIKIISNQSEYYFNITVLLCKQRNKMAASGKKRNVVTNVTMFPTKNLLLAGQQSAVYCVRACVCAPV